MSPLGAQICSMFWTPGCHESQLSVRPASGRITTERLMVYNKPTPTHPPPQCYSFGVAYRDLLPACLRCARFHNESADNIKKYWSRYYQGSQGVVFVLDSASSDEDLEAARNELHSALQHPQLCTLPFLILANHQDKPAARSPNQI
ncbi:hypothetical protein CRUP_030945 [Coryphaenoides rupestris]|nr:hypothetical protein CRUP_030945 [Coryphaenoides rupestris]